MKTVGDFVRVNHDGSWSKWKCLKCGREKHFVRGEEPNGKCECRKDGDGGVDSTYEPQDQDS